MAPCLRYAVCVTSNQGLTVITRSVPGLHGIYGPCYLQHTSLPEWQGHYSAPQSEPSQARRVVVSLNVDKALQEGRCVCRQQSCAHFISGIPPSTHQPNRHHRWLPSSDGVWVQPADFTLSQTGVAGDAAGLGRHLLEGHRFSHPSSLCLRQGVKLV